MFAVRTEIVFRREFPSGLYGSVVRSRSTENEAVFRENMSPPCSGQLQLHADLRQADTEDGSDMFLRNVD
jgi:hypothetical protein